ncbi:DUF4349 domain-containing protein [Mycobacterium sp. 236(2023)]|uniref:DUF4349 domain-containing protein n=1 Tax=Mycobacterium sp. 236(2023) TaxID=3038163 RepID=UPI00241514F8|nr:DUF4349 domain-containing protein [Mycobacterium sp. 236(2023)]MDG4664068.1 DUF4349 domain-containing protein [Mycobacterium sp. 236(2023)]
MNKITRAMALTVAGIATLGIMTGCAGQAPSSNESAATEVATPGGATDSFVGAAPEFGPPQAPPPVEEKRDVVKTASMTVTVPDPSEAADEAAVIVERSDGRVDSRTEDAGSGTGRAVTSVVLRVPVAKLDEVMRELKELGVVETASTTSEDVTAQRVDLDARIEALRTSVDRLLGIMRDARDPEALITAEDALSERQAELDSLRAQREALGDRVSYSTVDVTFYAEVVGGPAPEEYVGFLGQVRRGWDGLVAVTGGAILILGLMLPWLGVVVVLGAIVYGIVRVSQARSAAAPHAEVTPPVEPEQQPSSEPEPPRQ